MVRTKALRRGIKLEKPEHIIGITSMKPLPEVAINYLSKIYDAGQNQIAQAFSVAIQEVYGGKVPFTINQYSHDL